MKTTHIKIGGEAGQGIVTVGDLISKCLVREGLSICVSQDYESRIRGGHNTYSIRVGSEKVLGPKNGVEILVAFNEDTIAKHLAALTSDAVIVADISSVSQDARCLKVPYKEFGLARYINTAAAGVLAAILGIDRSVVATAITSQLAKKGQEIVDANIKVLDLAFAYGQQNTKFSRPLAKTPKGNDRVMMNGNEAIAFGALTAGLKFFSFYPMTPATTVSLAVAKWAKRADIVCEQAEDEIAAINMAIGAAYAGAPAMTATSGGGFALMAEGVSLAGMMEIPIVICVSQRPGPATGLPTRTEQADLEFVLHSGHGEFPRAIFAPGTVEECFYLTRKAFEVAERSQGPAFVLTDQYLADSYRSIEPFDLSKAIPVAPILAKPDDAIHYNRYAITDSGVSPRLAPGMCKSLVISDSDEHTEDGHLTEDLGVRVEMMDKRLKKADVLNDAVVAPTTAGADHPKKLFVCWGTTMGAVEEAVAKLNLDGGSAAMIHFSQVWPLVPSNFIDKMKGADEIIAVEGNATAQFARLIRRECGIEIKRRILRYDGLPITAEYIINALRSYKW